MLFLVDFFLFRRCQHFCSHDATFPCPPRLNQYLAENKVSCLGHYKVLPFNLLKIAILNHRSSTLALSNCGPRLFEVILYIPVKKFFSHVGCFLGRTSTKYSITCLAQGHTMVPPEKLKPTTPLSQVEHSTTGWLYR